MRRWLYPVLVVLLVVVVGAAVIAGGIAFWLIHRPLPEAVTDKPLFPGITYTLDVRPAPVTQIIHVVKIDLTTPGLSFFTTPHDDAAGTFNFAAHTTTQFLDEFDAQLAINGDYFDPWWANSLTDYYPHVGDGANVNGLAVSEGQIITTGYGQKYATLYITQDNHASFTAPDEPVYTAISGNAMFLLDGKSTLDDSAEPYLAERQPRTAVGLSADGNTLLLMVVDGRQPSYSTGASFAELTDLMRQYGANSALNLDGGGSSTLVIEGANGQPEILNSPIQLRIPGHQRPVANHLGVKIKT